MDGGIASGASDEALMARYQGGDAGALEALVRRHANPLLGFLVKMTNDRSRAEDLFQETFLRVHRKAASYDPQQRFKSWLYAIAAHAAIDAHRGDARAPATLSLDAAPEEGSSLAEQIAAETSHPSEALDREERGRRVRAAVGRLPERQRATLILAYFEGLPYAEVAAALGCSVGTVKTQVSRALQTLARILPDPAREGAR